MDAAFFEIELDQLSMWQAYGIDKKTVKIGQVYGIKVVKVDEKRISFIY